MIKMKTLLKEGAWGYGPLDNDSASDWKWVFGDMIIKEIKDKMESKDFKYKYYAIGMWQFFRVALETNYSVFKDDEIKEMNMLMAKTAKELLENPGELINQYKNPKEIKKYLLNLV